MSNKPKRKRLLTVAVVTVGLATYAHAIQTPHVGQFHDDAIYAVTARAIAAGEGPRIVSVPTAPVQRKYPPLYPLLLSVGWRASSDFPHNVTALKSLNVISLVWFLVASAVLFWRLTGWLFPIATAAFTLVVGLNPLVMAATDTLLSDNLFAALFVSALLLHCTSDRKPGSWTIVACAVVSGCALLTRQVGIALVVAGLVWAWQAGRRELVIYGCIVAVFTFATYGIFRGPLPTEPVLAYYSGYESDTLQRELLTPSLMARVLLDNATYARDGIAAFVLQAPFPGAGWVFSALGLAGLFTTIRRAGTFIAVTVVLYSAIVWAYPFNPIRYLLPLVPLIFITIFEGARWCAAALQRWSRGRDRNVFRLAVVLPLMLIVSTALSWAQQNYSDSKLSDARFWLVRPDYDWEGFAETFEWINSNTAPSDVLATAYDPMYFLYTGRVAVRPWIHQPDTYFYPRSRPIPHVGDPRLVRASLDRLGVRYLIIEPIDGYAERAAVDRMLVGLLQQYGSRAVLVFTSADKRHRVYKISPSIFNA